MKINLSEGFAMVKFSLFLGFFGGVYDDYEQQKRKEREKTEAGASVCYYLLRPCIR